MKIFVDLMLTEKVWNKINKDRYCSHHNTLTIYILSALDVEQIDLLSHCDSKRRASLFLIGPLSHQADSNIDGWLRLFFLELNMLGWRQ